MRYENDVNAINPDPADKTVFRQPVKPVVAPEPVDLPPSPPVFSGKDEDFPDWVRADMVWKQQHHEWNNRQLNLVPKARAAEPTQPVVYRDAVAEQRQKQYDGDAAVNANTEAVEKNTEALETNSEAKNADTK